MGRPIKVPISNILAIPEVSPRDPSLLGSYAKRDGLKQLSKDLGATLGAIATADTKNTPQGPALGSALGSLTVAKVPYDLPSKYARLVSEDTYILVDGIKRYEAITEAIGDNLRVSVSLFDNPTDTMGGLMGEAFRLNYPNSIPLGKGERLQHIMRLMLMGELRGSVTDLEKAYKGLASRATFAKMKAAADYCTDILNLQGRTYDDVKDLLYNRINEDFSYDLKTFLDSNGFVYRTSIVKWHELTTKGELEAEKQRERKQRERRSKAVTHTVEGINKLLEGLPPRDQRKVLQTIYGSNKRVMEQEDPHRY